MTPSVHPTDLKTPSSHGTEWHAVSSRKYAQGPELPTLGDSIYDALAHFAVPCLIGLILLVAVCAVISSSQKHFWYDDLFTVIGATRPTWHSFVQALPPEGNPPLNTLLTRFSVSFFGVSELSVRLPDMLGFLLAVVGTYLFVQREVGRLLGLLAAALVIGQPAWRYSYEARPYGLLLAFLMLALLSWQAAIRPRAPGQSRAPALAGLALGIVGCVFSHDIGIVEVAGPLLAGEAVRSFRNRRLDWPLLATGFVALPALAIVVPMMRRTNQVVISHAKVWEYPLTLTKLLAYARWAADSWHMVFSPALLGILAAVLVLHWRPKTAGRSVAEAAEDHATAVPAQPHILAAALGAALLIPITWLALLAGRGWYFCRYGIGSVLGVALLACLLLGLSKVPNKSLIVFLFTAALLSFAHSFWTGLKDLREQRQADDVVFADHSELPVVLSSPFETPRIWWYAPGFMKGRLVYLPYSSKNSPYLDLLQSTMLAEGPAFGNLVRAYGPFLQQSPHFLLDVATIGDTLINQLTEEGCTSTLVRANSLHRILDVHCDTPVFAKHTRQTTEGLTR